MERPWARISMEKPMCNHSYTADYATMPGSMGQRCPYPDLYETVRSRAASADEMGPALGLPIDSRGACIFHSQEAAWKRGNDFEGRFLQLVRLLDADPASKYYDFTEFIFVGSKPSDTEKHIFSLEDTGFRKHAYFNGAAFLDSFALAGVDFQDGATFLEAAFSRDLMIRNSRFRGLNFSKTKLSQCAFFTAVEFLSFSLFQDVCFAGPSGGFVVKFEDSRFDGITDFRGASFALGDESTAGFLKVRFEDFTDFTGTKFHCQVVFSEVSFASMTEFVDTSFDAVRSSARYRGAAVEFNQIEVTSGAVVAFISTDPQQKMFNQDVQMSFKEEPTGIIRFENANLNRFTTASRERLNRLAKAGKVEIGAGCIKYRFRTDLRTVSVSQGNAPLILELCQTFTNYFTVSNGLNLGFEIVERDNTKVSFFYFTDEDISELVFAERLAETEQRLWNLLSINSEEQLLIFEGATGKELTTTKESMLINAVDGMSALLGTFFRVGARIALGSWKEADTKALLGAIRFNEEGAEDRALNLHRVFVDKYTGRRLFGFNRQQNKLLAPMVIDWRKMLTPGRVKILFLGANSASSPLRLDKEVKKIQTSLKLAKERDHLELKQEWAVTVESLMQAMLDESPTIVHFSGHSDESGIILQDEMGKPMKVEIHALSSLFELFKDTVRCVVLNSCYSEHQAAAIRRHIPYVIGMRSSISNAVAAAFSLGFYKALGAGKDIPFAFEMGKASIQLEKGSSSDSMLVLL